MPRTTGSYVRVSTVDEAFRAFVPSPLPPHGPPLVVDGDLASLHTAALAALGRLDVAATMVPDADWFLYGFVRKESLLTSEIEGTQATLQDVVTFEATGQSSQPEGAQDVCNYLKALTYARQELARPNGLPLSVRLLCEAHKRLMRGVRGANKSPSEIRRSQNWIGGTRPSNARYVPPPTDRVPQLLTDLEKWVHSDDSLPPLVRTGLAHVQFETIHPFLDGNGRIGRLLITLLLEHWRLVRSPILYLSIALKRHQRQYYERLSAVRTDGDWEGWTRFYLDCVIEAAENGLSVAREIFALVHRDRARLLGSPSVTLSAVQLLERLPSQPVVTLTSTVALLKTTKPTAAKAIAALENAKILAETSGRQRDRVYVYRSYLDALSAD